jgi:hypothetical protein
MSPSAPSMGLGEFMKLIAGDNFIGYTITTEVPAYHITNIYNTSV